MPNYTLDLSLLDLKSSDIFKEIGYGNSQPEEEIINITDFLITEILSFVKPSYTLCLYDGKVEDSSVILDNYRLDTGRIIAGLLKGSERFCLFVATAGTSFQNFQNIIKEEDNIIQTFILDTIGTCIVEKTGDMMEKLLENEIGNYRHTHRFSPGYCGWDLTEQKILFKILGDNQSDVTLSETCLMSPVKSISGIIGIGKNVNEKKYGCSICELETCYKKGNNDTNKRLDK